MAFKDDLNDEVTKIFREQWEIRAAREVPAPQSLKLCNDAAELKSAAVLYADLSSSTNMVDMFDWRLAAEIYKTYLYCASRLIRNQGGVITSYDGDRVMGVFVGDDQATKAARCALKIHFAVTNIVNPALKKQYSGINFDVSQIVGIDVSEIRATRTGVRGDNDIVWVGRAANYAAKLTSAGSNFSSWITEDVYEKLDEGLKFGETPKRPIWEKRLWTPMNKQVIYGSNWWCPV